MFVDFFSTRLFVNWWGGDLYNIGSESAPCRCFCPQNKDKELSSHFVAFFRRLFLCGCLWYLCSFYGVNDVTHCPSVYDFVLMSPILVLVDLHELILCTVLVDVRVRFILILCGFGEKFDEHCTFFWRMYLAIQLYIVVSIGKYSYLFVWLFVYLCVITIDHTPVLKMSSVCL